MIVPCSFCDAPLQRFPSDVSRAQHPVCGKDCLRGLRRAGRVRCGGIVTRTHRGMRKCVARVACLDRPEWMPVDEFYRHRRQNGRYYRHSYCKRCQAVIQREDKAIKREMAARMAA